MTTTKPKLTREQLTVSDRALIADRSLSNRRVMQHLQGRHPDAFIPSAVLRVWREEARR